MGIYDRDYYRGDRPRIPSLAGSSVVTKIIALNVAIWFVQIIAPSITYFLALSADDLFGGFPQVWKLVTANFAHDPNGVFHVLANMLGVYIFGRELEEIYGPRDFLVLYLVAGVIAVFAEALLQQASGDAGRPILGASGSVMALVVVYATYFAHRTILLFFVFPMPVWVLCVLIIVLDVLGLLSAGGGGGVAHLAHLAGAGFGFAYRHFDLRIDSVRRRLGRGGRRPRRRSRRSEILDFPGAPRRERREPRKRREPTPPEVEDVSRRVDELLVKIHEQGIESLSREERRFLEENSGRYRSH